MAQAFVIMQIGNPDLDKVYEECIVRALKSCDLDPMRVDKHTEGRLLKSEIVGFIESSEIIVADLTNERPNCYLEIGYAMGLDKFRNLILTAREDHNQDSPNYQKGGPKVHFDLSGYQILFWAPDELDGFRAELEKRVRRRLATLMPSAAISVSPWDEEWIRGHQEAAFAGLALAGQAAAGGLAFMEIRMTLRDFDLDARQRELLRAASDAQVRTFGWPLGVVLVGDEGRPMPRTDGIAAEISHVGKNRYDYWTLRRDGTFYLLKSLFEDAHTTGTIFFNTRVVRITETLLYCVRLYSALGAPPDSRVLIGIRHGGLKDRVLSGTGQRHLIGNRRSSEDEVYAEVQTTLERVETDLIDLVERFTQPLFVVFDFFELGRNVLADIVDRYVDGRVT